MQSFSNKPEREREREREREKRERESKRETERESERDLTLLCNFRKYKGENQAGGNSFQKIPPTGDILNH